MAKRTHDVCRHIVEHYAGRTEAIWTGATSGEDLLLRVYDLPGFGKDKARIFVALLGKRLGVRPDGWETVAADWPSIADVDTFERVAEIRTQKREVKAARRAAAAKQPLPKRATPAKKTAKPAKKAAKPAAAKPPAAKKRASKSG
jgi:uncharacterized HhH-GPD family protein